MTHIGAMIVRDLAPAGLVEHARSIDPYLDELWVVEDLPYAGGIAQMTAILQATDRVVVGHGIAPAAFRNPASLAMEWATLAEMYPGRVRFGIGHGVQSWMAQIGEKVDSPLTLLAETISAVRSLLAGEKVNVDGRYVRLSDVGLVFPPVVVPPVLAGVVGPKSLELSGAYADGTILPEGHGPVEIAAAKRRIDEGRHRSGRSEPHLLTVFAGFYVGKSEGMASANPDAIAGWSAVSEDPSEVIEKLQSLIDAGVDSVVLVPLGLDAAQQLQLAGNELLPNLCR